MIVNLVFVRLRGTSKVYGFRDSFYLYGDKPKTYSKAEYERDAKLLFRSHLHRSHNSNQHLFF
jgi:hypothetical protein